MSNTYSPRYLRAEPVNAEAVADAQLETIFQQKRDNAMDDALCAMVRRNPNRQVVDARSCGVLDTQNQTKEEKEKVQMSRFLVLFGLYLISMVASFVLAIAEGHAFTGIIGCYIMGAGAMALLIRIKGEVEHGRN